MRQSCMICGDWVEPEKGLFGCDFPETELHRPFCPFHDQKLQHVKKRLQWEIYATPEMHSRAVRVSFTARGRVHAVDRVVPKLEIEQAKAPELYVEHFLLQMQEELLVHLVGAVDQYQSGSAAGFCAQTR